MPRPNFNQQIMLAADRQDAEIKRKKRKPIAQKEKRGEIRHKLDCTTFASAAPTITLKSN